MTYSHTDGPTDGHALMESLRRDLKTVGSLVFMKASVKKHVLRGLLHEDSYFYQFMVVVNTLCLSDSLSVWLSVYLSFPSVSLCLYFCLTV